MPNDFVLGIWSDGTELWLATSDGLGFAVLASGTTASSPANPPSAEESP